MEIEEIKNGYFDFSITSPEQFSDEQRRLLRQIQEIDLDSCQMTSNQFKAKFKNKTKESFVIAYVSAVSLLFVNRPKKSERDLPMPQS